MKNLIHLVLLLLTNTFYSQESSYIKKLDTIFVNFKEDSFQMRTILPSDDNNFQKRWYTVTLGDNYDRKFIRFYFQEYSSPEKRNQKIKSDVKIVKKTYLENHKKKIIGIDFFKSHDACTLKNIFYNKVVYIIDITERKKNKKTLYEVTPSFSCDAIE